MSEADDRLHLEEMLAFAARIVEHTAKADRDAFLASTLHRDALSMWLLALGEGAARLSGGLKAQAPDVPWREMVNLRHRLAHAYSRANPAVLFDTALDYVPAIIPELQRLLASLD